MFSNFNYVLTELHIDYCLNLVVLFDRFCFNVSIKCSLSMGSHKAMANYPFLFI